MSETGIDGVTIHPLIAAQEQRDERAVEFRGFLGTTGARAVRLYPDLDTTSYVEIPKDAVLHWEKDADAVVGKIRVYVAAACDVTEVHRRRVVARSSALSVYGARRGSPCGCGARLTADERRLALARPPRPMTAFTRCVIRCEGAFASMATRAAVLDARAAQEPDALRSAQLFSQAEDIKSQAKTALYDCLRRCPGRPRFRSVRDADGRITRRPFSIGELAGEICRRHLGEVSCAE